MQDTVVSSKKYNFIYHNISNRFNVGINNISPKSFKKHLDFFSNLSDISICFDDAYEDIYIHAFPLLKKYTFNKIIFPITDYIGKYNKWDVNFIINKKMHINKNQILDLDNNGWIIGSHGKSHISYKTLNDNQVYEDLSKSKDFLEKLLNKEVSIFTPPFGYLDKAHIPLIIKAGYKKIYLNSCYLDDSTHNDSIKIENRLNVYKHDSINSLKRKIEGHKIQSLIDRYIHYCSNATVFVKKLS